MRRLLVLALVLLLNTACGSSAAGSGAVSSTTANDDGPTITSSDVVLAGAMQHIAQQLGIRDIASIDIGQASGHLAFLNGNQVSFIFDASTGQPLVKSEWEAFVATGILRDEASDLGATPVVGITLSNGTTVNLTGVDHPVITQTAMAESEVSGALDAMGLKLVSMQVAQMDHGAAVSITAQSSDIAAWGAKFGNDAVSRVFGDINSYEGTYLKVDDSQGSPHFVSAYATRAAHGSGWISKELQPYDNFGDSAQTVPQG